MNLKVISGLLIVLLIVIGIELTRTHAPVPPLPQAVPSTASEELLDRRIPELILHDSTLEKAVAALQEKTGMPIEVDWAGLDKWKDLPVDFELHDVKLGDVVAFLFSYRRKRIHEFFSQPDFDVAGGKLLIAEGREIPSSILAERIYDVRDLLTDEYWGYPPGTCTAEIQDSRADSLCRVLQSATEIRNCPDNRGGTRAGNEEEGQGRYEHLAGRVFAVQTTYNHRLLESVLARLRTGDSRRMSRAPMDRRIDHLEFRATPLRAVIRQIAEKSHANIVLEPPGFSRDELDPLTPITFTIHDASLEEALTALLHLLPHSDFNEFGNGIIAISPGPSGDGIMEAIDASELIKQTRRPLSTIDPTGVFRGDSPYETASGASLQNAIFSLSPDPDAEGFAVTIFGTRILSHGGVRASRRVRDAVDALEHPINLSVATRNPNGSQPSSRLAQFQWYDIRPGEAFKKLREASGPNLRWRLTSPVDDHGRFISINGDDTTVENIAREIVRTGNLEDQIVLSYEDGVVCVDPVEVNAMRVVRAYDVTRILEQSDKWYQDNDSANAPQSLDERKGQALAQLISQQYPPAFWHGRLLTYQTPSRQRRLFYFLRRLQAGDAPPEMQFGLDLE